MSRIGFCVRSSMGHRFHPGETRCIRCEYERPLIEAQDEADARDARLELNRAEWESMDVCSDGERDVRSHEVER